jgi:hypothetical protein
MIKRALGIALSVWIACAVFAAGSGAEETTAVVSGGGCDLKARPDIAADSVVTIPGGEAVLLQVRLEETDTVAGVVGHWYFVRYRGIDGWVFDARLDTTDPRAKALYRDVPSLGDEMDRLHDAKESGALEKTVRLATGIVSQIEGNFSTGEIGSSKRLSEMILGSLSDKIGALVYLHRFEEARAQYDYLKKTYPNARLENGAVDARELIGPYMVFADRYKSAPLFDNPNEPKERLIAALKKRDIAAISSLALPGLFEVWVAYTDWGEKLADKSLGAEPWLAGRWNSAWSMGKVVKETDDGKVIGYCVITEPWEVDYYGFPVHRIDFCIDRLPDGTFAFSYLILYTTPSQ